MKKTVYIIGHRNPDTDSVVSAAAYAHLKQELGQVGCKAARAGKMSPQTEYIFNRFKVAVPEYIPELLPKVNYYMEQGCNTVDEGTSLWAAVAKMEESQSKVLPVVDKEGKYQSLLHYNAFAQNVLKLLNPEKEAAVTTSIKLIHETLNAQPLILHNEDDLFKCTILVGAAEFSTFKTLLDERKSENVVVITGDRVDVQEYCIDSEVKALVITSGFVLNKELRAKAEKKGVSVLISPYDTSATAMLSVYSTAVSVMSDKDIKPVKALDTVRKIQPQLRASPSRCLPVINDNGQVTGIISESDLLHEANIELILVDHNEMSQAVEGIENYIIQEIIDHHRLGNLSTKYPITFINKPVGATATLVTSLYREYKVSIPKDIACLLLSAILSDTLILQSSTTTDVDRETAEYLSNITNLDILELGQDIVMAASRIGGRTASEVIHQDMKEYSERTYRFTVSQIEVDNMDEILKRKEEFLSELEIERRSQKLLFCAIMVTDITQLTSILIVAGEKPFMQHINFPLAEDSVYIVNDIVSRKKQLVPLLSEQIENFDT